MTKKTLLAALAAMLIFATPALAERVLVVTENLPAAGVNQNAPSRFLHAVMGVLNSLGVDYDVVDQEAVASYRCPSQNLNQAALRTGKVYWDVVGNYKQYGAMIHVGWYCNNTTNWATGYRPDSLTQIGMWPSIPHLFLGPRAITSANLFDQSTACSLGVNTATTLTGAPVPTVANSISAYMPGSDYIWSVATDGSIYYNSSGAGGLRLDRSVHRSNIMYKSRIVLATNAVNATDAPAGRCGGLNKPTVNGCCDSIGTRGGYFDTPWADTALVWTMERNLDGLSSGDSAMLIFAPGIYCSGSGTSLQPTGLLAMCVAMLDSATRNKVVTASSPVRKTGIPTIIGQKADWSPLKFGVYLDGAFTRGVSNVLSVDSPQGHGMQIASGLNDSTFIKSSIDSLNTLDIPIVVGVNIDSVYAYPYEKAWWSGLRQARFSPSLRAQTVALTNNVGPTNASRYVSPDVFGLRRNRDFITPTRYASGDPLTAACDGTDTTLSCLLSYSKFRLDSIPEFKGRMSSTIVAPLFDYWPGTTNLGTTAINRWSMGVRRDSLDMALYRAGFNAAIINTMRPTSPGMTVAWNPGTNPIVPLSTDPRSWTGVTETRTNVRWLTTRLMGDENVDRNIEYAAHAHSGEFLNGLFTNLWWVADLLNYEHQFHTRLNVAFLRVGDLGFTPTAGNSYRPGWYAIKNIVNQARAINKFAGRTVVAIVYPEDIEPLGPWK